MKAVMASVQPQWCEKIASRDKSLEVRKTKPNIPVPFKCYIYQTRRRWWYEILGKLSACAWVRAVMEGQGKVIGEFTCDDVKPIFAQDFIVREDAIRAIKGSCLTPQEVKDYAGWKKGIQLFDCKELYGWHISNLVIYDSPRELKEFRGLRETKFGFEPVALTRPPQSWYYVEELEGGGEKWRC